MESTIHGDLIRGHINTIILRALNEGDRYGYDIVKEIDSRSSGQYQLKQPTLYSCLKRLENQGFISSYWGEESNGGRRKYFTLTDMGKELFLKSQTEWEYSRTVIDNLISAKEFDLSTARPPIGHDSAKKEPTVKKSKNQIMDDEILEDTFNSSEVDESILGSVTYNPDESELEHNTIDGQFAINSENDVSPIVAGDADNQERQPPREIVTIDAEKFLSDIFSQEHGNSLSNSYATKLSMEQYVPNTIMSDSHSYFSDLLLNSSDEIPFEMMKSTRKMDIEEEKVLLYNKLISDSVPANSTTSHNAMPSNTHIQSIPLAHNTATRNDETSDFNKYNNSFGANEFADKSKAITDREYKNILGKLINNNSKFQENMEKQVVPQSNSVPIIHRQFSDKMNKVVTDIGNLGEDVKIRTHNNQVSKSFSNKYYYYNNKLMLSHYAILFVIMLIEISVIFLALKVGFKISQKYDMYYYLGAVIFATLFPLFAFICNMIDSNKRKRYGFQFKNAIVVRIFFFLQFLVIIYSVNILCDMPLIGSTDFIVSLLLPAVLSLNIPISAVIFQLLYNSKRYCAEIV